ncbi:MAG: hypothetical protein Q7U28_16870 [Aquabacterium sp.]|nr:hypothetical protein [Aquabacterium sp.]
MQNTICEVWGLDGPDGIGAELIGNYPGAGDANNLGKLTYGLSKISPNDRIGYGMFQEDATYSAFSYG